MSPSTAVTAPRTQPRRGPSHSARSSAPSRSGPTPPGKASQTRLRDDWPRTTRPLPWLIAFFLALIWLVPVDSISLTVNLPFDLHLDRIVLPFIVLAWGMGLAVGGVNRPRLHLSGVHIAIAIFLLVCFISVVVNAEALNQALAIKTAIKQLLLLSSWCVLFAVIASSVRPSEVMAFVKFILLLGVICGIGVLWEYRFHYNAFYGFSESIFTGVFVTNAPALGGVDEIGRVVVLGPTAVGLEVAAMLSMALPVALIGLMTSPRRRTQFLYGLAACVIMAGGLATYKKTAIVAPAIILVALGVMWPRRLVRLVPLLVILVGASHFLAPGAIGSVIQQFTGGKLTSVGTTVHRLDGYDAVRPIIMSHPILGEGVGGYNSLLNRILDNQMLDNLIQTGFVGEFAFIGMVVAVVATAVPLVRRTVDDRSKAALAAACAAVSFLTVSFLFDSMAYTHVPYIFLTFAGLLVVLVTPPESVKRAGLILPRRENAV